MDNTEYLVLCDNAAGKAKRGQTKITLELDKNANKKKSQGKDKIHLGTNNIKRLLTNNLSHVMLDLLEIATFVYVTGQLTTRGGLKEFEYGSKWYRHFSLVIPVRHPEIWNREKALLEGILEFVAGERYVFKFTKKNTEGPLWLDYQEGLEPDKDYTDVVLLSGGLDSFSGGMTEIASKHKTIFVSHQSETKMTGLQSNVFEYIEKYADACHQPFHIPVKIYKGGQYVTKDTNQRNRSFLFAALGAVVANCLNLNKVTFYENGIISCNLPFDKQTYQAQRTRSTHPKFFGEMSNLLSNILDREFRFVNPFFDNTRMEVIRNLITLNHQEGIRKTRSCASSRYQDGWRHDATCSQCVDRRFATLANDCADFDLQGDYRLNIFVEELDSTHDRTMVFNYVALAQRIMKLPNEQAFIKEFSSDIYDITNHLGIPREQAAKQIYELYKRHSAEVLKVVKSQLADNLDNYTLGLLPKHCLLRLMALDELNVPADGVLPSADKKKLEDIEIDLSCFNKGPSKNLLEDLIAHPGGVNFDPKHHGKQQPLTLKQVLKRSKYADIAKHISLTKGKISVNGIQLSKK